MMLNSREQFGVRHLLVDMLGYLPAQIAPAIAGIALLPILTRLLPPQEYGHYVLVLTTVSVLTVITGWVGMAVVRFFPACRDERDLRMLYASVVAWLGLSIAVLTVFFICALLALAQGMSSELFSAMLLGIFLFAVLAASDLLQSFLRVRRFVRWYSAFAVWRALVGLGLGIGLVATWNIGARGLLLGSIVANGLAIPVLWAVATRGISFGLRDFSLPLSKELARYSFPLVVGNLEAWILSLSDRYVLEFYRGSFEVGLYSISYRVSESSILLLTSLFAFAFNPLSVIVWEKEGQKAAQKFVQQGTRYFLILCFPAVVGLSVLHRPIVEVLAAQDYWAGATVLPWVAAGVFLLGLTQRFGAGLSFHKRTTLYMLCILAAGGLNLGLNFAFVPTYGFRAAAVSTAASYAALLALTVPVSRQFFRWSFPFRSLGRTAGASAIMAAAIYPVGNSMTGSQLANLAVAVPLGILVYALALVLLGEIQPNEKEALRELAVRYLPGWVVPTGLRKGP